MTSYCWTVLCVASAATAPAVVVAQNFELLYEQDFENPDGFVNDGGDFNISRTVNENYANQPVGFQFAQANTVETLFINGNSIFGTGYTDVSDIGGDYALGLLSSVQNDLLGLSFDVGDFDFLVLQMDISSIDLDRNGGPFVSDGDVPVFEFSLFDNPGGSSGLGSGTPLVTDQVSGIASPQSVFDWTAIEIPLDASSATDGNVILRIDLLEGGYAAMDNFRIFASATPTVPEPTTGYLLGTAGLILVSRRRLPVL